MKPTRTCHWPPRLDVTLSAPVRLVRRTRIPVRHVHAIHPLLRAVARARWGGRLARQRRFEKPAPPRAALV